MLINSINDSEAHLAALKRIEQLWEAEPQTPEGDELEALIMLVEAYEDLHYPIEAPSQKGGASLVPTH